MKSCSGHQRVLQKSHKEIIAKFFFFFCPIFNPLLAIFSEKHTLVFCTDEEQDSHKPLGHFDRCAAIGMFV